MKRLTILILLSILASACSILNTSSPTSEITPNLPDPGVTTIPAPDPNTAAHIFLDAWKRNDYPVMYGMLTPLAQDGLSLEAFVDRYEEIHRTAALTGIDTQIISSLVMNPGKAEVRFRTVLHSVVIGDISRENRMDLRREDGDWHVAWTEALILPELTGGNGLRLDQYTPTRANIYDRNGNALAAQKDAVALWIVPNQIGLRMPKN